MDEHCPHCGARLPIVRDAFCGVCRADLGEPPVRVDQAPRLAPPSEEQVASDETRALRVAIFLSVLVYVPLIGTLFAPEIRAKMVEAFGREPLGLPVLVFAIGLQTLLYLPIPRAFYHSALIGEQARRDGRVLLSLGGLLYLVEVDRRHPHLARSRRICLGSLGYFIAVVAVWIVYTLALGI